MSKPLEPTYFFYRNLKALDKARGYDRTRLLKKLALDAGKLVAKDLIYKDVAKGLLLACCRVNKLACSHKSTISYGTSYCLNVIERYVEKGQNSNE